MDDRQTSRTSERWFVAAITLFAAIAFLVIPAVLYFTADPVELAQPPHK